MALKQTKDGYFESQARKPSLKQKQLAVQKLTKQIKPGSDLQHFLRLSTVGKVSE